MLRFSRIAHFLMAAAMSCMAMSSQAAEGGRLASVDWLKQNLGRADLVVLDASPPSMHRKAHIVGAVSANRVNFGPMELSSAAMEKQLRGWGLNPGQQIVISDEGGSYWATKLFWDLLHYGVPAQSMRILDGGLAKWQASGGAVTPELTPAPRPGSITLGPQNPQVRVRLPEFLAATSDPQHTVSLEALEPSYYFGGAAFFNRGGHVPHATLMPSTDFFNADKTFKSPQEIQRMLSHLGVTPDKQIHTYCGGGGAAAVPFFALGHILDYPQVKLFQESQYGWLQDERELPMWTYADPHRTHDTAWLKAWGSPMLKAFGLSKLDIVDVRAADEFKLGHVPLSVNLPALREPARKPEALAALLTQAGVDRANEAVVVSEGGINPNSALAALMLESLGQHKVSIYLDSIERWAELGHPVARPAAAAAPPAAIKTYTVQAKGPSPWVDDSKPQGLYPRIYIASGPALPARQPQGRVLHLPYAQFLNAGGQPKPAREIWNILDKAGVPRYAELVVYGDTPGEAAVNYLVLRLMGFADVKVWAP